MLLRKIQGWFFLWACSATITWSIHNLVLCVFLVNNTWLNIYMLLTHYRWTHGNHHCNSWLSDSHVYFLCKAHHKFLVLRNTGTSELGLAAVKAAKWPIKSTKKKHPNMAIHNHKKGAHLQFKRWNKNAVSLRSISVQNVPVSITSRPFG